MQRQQEAAKCRGRGRMKRGGDSEAQHDDAMTQGRDKLANEVRLVLERCEEDEEQQRQYI